MSTILNGKIVDTELSHSAMGGTEMMRKRLLENVPPHMLQGVAIHFSRPREIRSDVKNILYCHDLPLDPENKILLNEGWKKLDHFVFVSNWQRDGYIQQYGIPHSKTTVIENAIEKEYVFTEKSNKVVRFIYHTTPHRGLQLLYPIFDKLSQNFSNVHLDVYSSFGIYGWPQRDEPYKNLFGQLEQHPKITYHGSKSNSEVLEALEKSHIFLYPCIWQETSCIAMIEAIRSNCIVIHPNHGALRETANGATMMYEYTENYSDHATRAYAIANLVTKEIVDGTGFINTFIRDRKYNFETPNNSIVRFGLSWNKLLEKIKYE